MVLSASRRTDIPSFYSQWLMNRLRAGYVLVRNPMNHAQVSRVALSSDAVDCIVFWTKDPVNLLDKLPEIDAMGYRYYFQFTLTPYGKTLEPGLRDKADIVETFVRLGELIGKDRIVWRYDPIVVSGELDAGYHVKRFAALCGRLHPYAKYVNISFVDMYAKVRSKLIRPVTPGEMAEIAGRFAEIAAHFGLPVRACCEPDLLDCGIQPASCIDKSLVEELCGYRLNAVSDKNQRAGCRCVQSVDIGTYNTCAHGCAYCYANASVKGAAANRARHDPLGEFLLGGSLTGDRITERRMVSLKESQTGLFGG